MVKVEGDGTRPLTFDNVAIRVDPNFATYMHVDYDEINAASLFGKDPMGEIIKK